MARAKTTAESFLEEGLLARSVSQNVLQDIEKLEDSLWAAADNLRANSKLTSSEYCMPVLGVIFLRHATNRYDDAAAQIEADQAAGKMPKRPLVKQRLHQAPRADAARRKRATTSCSSCPRAPTSARPSSRR